MKVHVPLHERSYDIHIEPNILSRVLAACADLPLPKEIAILSNETVFPIYGEKLFDDLTSAGHRVDAFVIPDGEKYKSLEQTSRAYDFLAEFGLRRSGIIIALGGGVVGDLAGFVAATWMRGIDFLQIPTTLLAMVDSSVGGKTGVNHARAKNLIGAFHQPQRVLIDPRVLATLAPREVRAGMAEVIKYGVIADADFFAWLEENLDVALKLDEDVLQKIIARSCEIKAQVVGEDERESDAVGLRATLNYGHTVGHAIEATTAYGTYLHGEAISIGMTVAARLALQLGTIEAVAGRDLLTRQTQLFSRVNLPTQMPHDYNFDDLWAAMTLDKKTRDGSVNFILPDVWGHVRRVENVGADAVRVALHEL